MVSAVTAAPRLGPAGLGEMRLESSNLSQPQCPHLENEGAGWLDTQVPEACKIVCGLLRS